MAVTGNRIYLYGEQLLFTREADLSTAMVNHESGSVLPSGQGRGSLLRQSWREEDSLKIEISLPAAGYQKRAPQQESQYISHQKVLKTSEETQTCVGAGSCQRLHLSDPHLCKKIVEKARRVFSKWGRKPESKTGRNLSDSAVSFQNSIDVTKPMQGAYSNSDYSFETAFHELSADDCATYELPGEGAVTDRAAVYEAPGDFVRQKPQQTSYGYYSEVVLPQSPFHRYSGSGSSISTWSQNPSHSSSSTRYTSYTDLPGLTTPAREPSELEGSFSGSSSFSLLTPITSISSVLPVICENAPAKSAPAPAGIFDWPRSDVGVNTTPESISWLKQPLTNSLMGDWDLCASPTSFLPAIGPSNGRVEEGQVHELGLMDCDVYEAAASEAIATTLPSEKVMISDYPGERFSHSSIATANDLGSSNNCGVSVSLCPCHGLPMRPDMDLSDLVAGAKSCCINSHLLVQGNNATLGWGIQSMFNFLLELAQQKFDAFEPEVQIALTPAFSTAPTFQASLEALRDLHAGQPSLCIHGLVSLVFMAFSIVILTIDEIDRSQCTEVMYTEMTSWSDTLSSPAHKHAFGTFLVTLWSPQIRYPSASIQQTEFCPFIIPKGLRTQAWRSSKLPNRIGLRIGMTVSLCQYYVDLILNAAQNEVTSYFYSPDHLLGKAPPPVFMDSALDLMQPYLERTVSESMREVVSSTVEALRDGRLSSFTQVETHLKVEVHNRHRHFGNFSSRISQIFSTMCHNATAIFDCRKVVWLMKILQEAANRVVSQSWAEGVDSPKANMQDQEEGLKHSSDVIAIDSWSKSSSDLNQLTYGRKHIRSQPSLNKSTAGRKTDRQRKVSKESVPSQCAVCGTLFKGKCRRDHLRRHLRSVHGNHKIICNLCGHIFKYRTDNFSKHLKACQPQHGT